MFTPFLNYLKIRNYAQNTIDAYSRYLAEFEKFLNGETLTLSQVHAFQLSLMERKLMPSTIHFYLVAIRRYLRWMQLVQDELLFDYRKIELPRYELSRQDYLTKTELQKFFRAIPQKNIQTLRDRTMISLLYVGGLRVSELTSINRSDINFESNEIPIRGKGGKRRPIYLTSDVAVLLKDYLKTRKDNFPALFVSYSRPNEDHRLSTVSVELIIRKYAKKAKISKPVTPHTLRRSFATNLVLNGCPLSGAKDMLGHQSIITTQSYIRFSNSDLKPLHAKYLTPIA